MMKEIRIGFSNSDTPDSVITDLMQIEQNVYSPEYRGEYHAIKSRFDKYKDMFILAYDKDRIIGYLCYFPITKSLHDSILCEAQFHDDDILPNDVIEMGGSNHIYLLSIAVYKKYQGMGVGTMLTDAFFDRLRLEKEKGHHIEDIIASVVSLQGEQIAWKYNFSMIKDLSEIQQYKLFYFNGGNL